MKMAPSRGEIKWKKIILCKDCQSNTKAIGVILKPGPSGNLVVKNNCLLVMAL